jgi:ribonuclease-3
MTANKSSALQRSLSVLGKLFAGTRKGPSGSRVRKLRKLQQHIGVRFTDISLLEQALTHRSYSHVTAQTRNDSNERMEFLGDSVLGLSVSQFLYLRFPDRSEGALSKMKSLLVSRKVLSTVSRDVGLGEFLLLSGEESDMGGRDRTSILADSFEGVIGAIYLDQGYRAANKFVQRFLLSDIHEILKDEDHTNFKSLLQEYVQSKRLSHPVYRVRREEGPEHEKEFAVEVVVRGEVWGTGRGKSKKDAEQSAARVALETREGGEKPTSRSKTRAPRGDRAAAPVRSRESTRKAPQATAKDRGEHGISASREKHIARRQEEAQGNDTLRRRSEVRSRGPQTESASADGEAPRSGRSRRGRRRRGERSDAPDAVRSEETRPLDAPADEVTPTMPESPPESVRSDGPREASRSDSHPTRRSERARAESVSDAPRSEVEETTTAGEATSTPARTGRSPRRAGRRGRGGRSGSAPAEASAGDADAARPSERAQRQSESQSDPSRESAPPRQSDPSRDSAPSRSEGAVSEAPDRGFWSQPTNVGENAPARADRGDESRAERAQDARAESRSESRPESRAEPRSESRPESRSESRSEPRAESRSDARETESVSTSSGSDSSGDGFTRRKARRTARGFRKR